MMFLIVSPNTAKNQDFNQDCALQKEVSPSLSLFGHYLLIKLC